MRVGFRAQTHVADRTLVRVRLRSGRDPARRSSERAPSGEAHVARRRRRAGRRGVGGRAPAAERLHLDAAGPRPGRNARRARGAHRRLAGAQGSARRRAR